MRGIFQGKSSGTTRGTLFLRFPPPFFTKTPLLASKKSCASEGSSVQNATDLNIGSTYPQMHAFLASDLCTLYLGTASSVGFPCLYGPCTTWVLAKHAHWERRNYHPEPCIYSLSCIAILLISEASFLCSVGCLRSLRVSDDMWRRGVCIETRGSKR